MALVKFWPSTQAVPLAPDQEWPVVWHDSEVPREGDVVAFGGRRWVVDLVLWTRTDVVVVDIRVHLMQGPGFDDPWVAVGIH